MAQSTVSIEALQAVVQDAKERLQKAEEQLEKLPEGSPERPAQRTVVAMATERLSAREKDLYAAMSAAQQPLQEELARLMVRMIMDGVPPSSSASSTFSPLKTRLVDFYSTVKRGRFGDEIYDMCTHQHLPRIVVTAAHLLSRSWGWAGQKMFRVEDINDVRNGLLLLTVVEAAFDKWQLCLIPQPGLGPMQSVIIHILDPDLAQKTLVSMLPQNIGQGRYDNAALTALLAHRLDNMTFQDLHGRPLEADPDIANSVKCFTRVLYWHALVATQKAKDQGWFDRGSMAPDLSSVQITPNWQDRIESWQQHNQAWQQPNPAGSS